MFQVKATRPKLTSTPPQLTPEPAASHALAVVAMIRLMKDFGTVEIERVSRLGFRHPSVR
jgi:hypothetical protein